MKVGTKYRMLLSFFQFYSVMSPRCVIISGYAQWGLPKAIVDVRIGERASVQIAHGFWIPPQPAPRERCGLQASSFLQASIQTEDVAVRNEGLGVMQGHGTSLPLLQTG